MVSFELLFGANCITIRIKGLFSRHKDINTPHPHPRRKKEEK